MSWHYLQEQVAESYPGICLIGAPYALSRLTPFVATSCSSVKPMECCNDSQFGTMCEHSLVGRGADTSMSSAADSPARISAQQANTRASTDPSLDYGESLRASLARFGLDLRLLKTHHTYEATGSLEYSGILPAWGMMLGGVYWGLATSAPRISEIASGYLPTPTTIGNELAPSMRKHACHRRLMALLPQLRKDLNCPGKGPWVAFREWLMGWPIGWTGLEPLETGKYLAWLHWHLPC